MVLFVYDFFYTWSYIKIESAPKKSNFVLIMGTIYTFPKNNGVHEEIGRCHYHGFRCFITADSVTPPAPRYTRRLDLLLVRIIILLWRRQPTKSYQEELRLKAASPREALALDAAGEEEGEGEVGVSGEQEGGQGEEVALDRAGAEEGEGEVGVSGQQEGGQGEEVALDRAGAEEVEGEVEGGGQQEGGQGGEVVLDRAGVEEGEGGVEGVEEQEGGQGEEVVVEEEAGQVRLPTSAPWITARNGRRVVSRGAGEEEEEEEDLGVIWTTTAATRRAQVAGYSEAPWTTTRAGQFSSQETQLFNVRGRWRWAALRM